MVNTKLMEIYLPILLMCSGCLATGRKADAQDVTTYLYRGMAKPARNKTTFSFGITVRAPWASY